MKQLAHMREASDAVARKMGRWQPLRMAASALAVALLALACAFGVGGQVAYAAGEADLSSPAHSKTATQNSDGSYTITLDVTGNSTQSKSGVPVDVVLVMDSSGSMAGNRWQTVTSAASTLAKTVLTDANAQLEPSSQIQMSVVDFDTNARIMSLGGSNWTTDSNAVIGSFGGMDASENGGGTNWEDALVKANSLSTGREGAKKNIVFLSDGAPTFRNSEQGATSWWISDWNDRYDVYGNGQDDPNGWNYDAAVQEANGKGNGVRLFSVSAATESNSSMRKFANDVNNQSGDASFYDGSNADALSKAFADIAQQITKSASYDNVKVTDKLSEWFVGTGVDGTPADFTYQKDGQPWNDAPQATVDGNGQVSWDLSSIGELKKDVTYSVSFKVFPNQSAYDDAAGDNPKDAYPTNGGAGLSYEILKKTDGVVTGREPGETTYESPTVTVPYSEITLAKVWGDSQDAKPESVTVDLHEDGANTPTKTVVLSAENGWKQTVRVPAGVQGHSWSVKEHEVNGWTSKVEASAADNAQVREGSLVFAGGLAAQGTFTITNTPSEGAVSLTKKVAAVPGLTAPTGETYRFVASIKNADGSPVSGAKLEGVEGKATISDSDELELSADQTVTVSGLKPGATVKFSEKVPDGYQAEMSEVSATVEAGKTQDLAVTNTYRGFGLKVFKTDESDQPLAGAKFTITRQGDVSSQPVETGNDGYATLAETLVDGTYTISETYVPSGYQRHADMTLVVSENGRKATLDGAEVNAPVDGYYVIKIQNKANVTSIPTTGGTGNVPLFAGGMALVAGAAALVARSRINS